MSAIARIFLIIGGLNWGLVGIGYFFKKDLNFLKLLSAYYVDLPAIIYLVIAACAIWYIFRN